MHTDIFSITSFKHGEKVEDGVRRIVLDDLRDKVNLVLIYFILAFLLGASLIGIFVAEYSLPSLPVDPNRVIAIAVGVAILLAVIVVMKMVLMHISHVNQTEYSPCIYLEDGKGGILCSPSGEIVVKGLVQRAGEHIVMKADSLLQIQINDHRSYEVVFAQLRIPLHYEEQFSVLDLQSILRDSESTYPLSLRVEEILRSRFLIPSPLQHVSGEKFSDHVDFTLPSITIGAAKKTEERYSERD